MVEDKLTIDEMSMSELLAGMPEKVSNGSVVQARVLGKNADGVLVDIGVPLSGSGASATSSVFSPNIRSQPARYA